MLYRVRFEYARNIQASSKQEALDKICKLMKENPETFIRDVADASATSAVQPLWKRVLTGR
jgi:hypothetical protein